MGLSTKSKEAVFLPRRHTQVPAQRPKNLCKFVSPFPTIYDEVDDV